MKCHRWFVGLLTICSICMIYFKYRSCWRSWQTLWSWLCLIIFWNIYFMIVWGLFISLIQLSINCHNSYGSSSSRELLHSIYFQNCPSGVLPCLLYLCLVENLWCRGTLYRVSQLLLRALSPVVQFVIFFFLSFFCFLDVTVTPSSLASCSTLSVWLLITTVGTTRTGGGEAGRYLCKCFDLLISWWVVQALLRCFDTQGGWESAWVQALRAGRVWKGFLGRGTGQCDRGRRGEWENWW